MNTIHYAFEWKGRVLMAKILLVEHDQDLREDIATRLTELGHDIVGTRDGHGGIKAIQELHPDVVLADVGAPFERELVRNIARDESRNADIDLVLISPASSTRAIINGLHDGADDFVLKPINYSLLQAKIEAFLRKRGNLLTEFNLERFALLAGEATVAGATFVLAASILGFISIIGLYLLKSGLGIDIFKDIHFFDLFR